MHLRSADPVFRFSIRESHQNVEVVIVDRRRNDFDLVLLKLLDNCTRRYDPLF